MSFEYPTDAERELHDMITRLRTELSSVRCLVTGLCQHIKANQGQEALDAVLATALDEVKGCDRAYALPADSHTVQRFADGFVKR
ncbi:MULTISPECIES: hypothetical protein [unclassified Pseudomonas]|uniref:hypothetical protein n=1 Tax=unclassified Pseudomonas TaxID=196821 RepID=UPI002647945F|nr:hypothetical protein [Pseudomonas sp.]MDN5518502.1 hypothetical protein [Pseudomonas sp.]MDN5531544.1 hypothetical protein [Pseudomonas sp.]